MNIPLAPLASPPREGTEKVGGPDKSMPAPSAPRAGIEMIRPIAVDHPIAVDQSLGYDASLASYSGLSPAGLTAATTARNCSNVI